MTNRVDANLISSIALAFEDNVVYPVHIRKRLVFQGLTKPNRLHHKAIKYVSVKAQAMLVNLMLEAQLPIEKEEDVYKCGRNTNSHIRAKDAGVVIYRMSAGSEAVMGYLHMTGQIERLEKLIDWCIQTVEKIGNWLQVKITTSSHMRAGFHGIITL